MLVAAGTTSARAAIAEEGGAAEPPINKAASSGAAGNFPIETTWPDREVRHSISDAELEMLHKGHADDRVADKAFDIFLAACGAGAGAFPQVAKDLWGAFRANPPVPHDVFGIFALVIFAGAVGIAAVTIAFWKKPNEPSAVDRRVAEIRERTNRTQHFVGPAQPTTGRTQ